MSVRSEVGIVLVKELEELVYEKASDSLKRFLNIHDDKIEKNGDVLYVYDEVKWYCELEGSEPNELITLLNEHGDVEDYYIIEVCSEFKSVETWGEYSDNEFFVSYTMGLSYNK